MTTDLLEARPQIAGSAAVLADSYGVLHRIPPSGYAQGAAGQATRRVYIIVTPIQTPADSAGGQELSEYIERDRHDRLQLVSEAARQLSVSSSRLTRAAVMNPWAAKNRRRIRLIETKHKEHLTEREAEELARLKREVAAHMQVVAPRSTEVLDEMSARIERLKKKVQAKRGKQA
jgi:hypothetical protein